MGSGYRGTVEIVTRVQYITIAARLMHAGDCLRAPVKLMASAPPMQGSRNAESCVAQSRPVAELFYFVHR